MTRRTIFSLAAAALLSTGCVGNYTGRPDQRGPRAINAHSRPDLARRVEWRRIMRGAGTSAVLMGYVRTDGRARAGQQPSYWIYNDEFVLTGRVSPRGRVMKINLDGSEEWVGNYTLELACLRVFGFQSKKTILFEPMPEPR